LTPRKSLSACCDEVSRFSQSTPPASHGAIQQGVPCSVSARIPISRGNWMLWESRSIEMRPRDDSRLGPVLQRDGHRARRRATMRHWPRPRSAKHFTARQRNPGLPKTVTPRSNRRSRRRCRASGETARNKGACSDPGKAWGKGDNYRPKSPTPSSLQRFGDSSRFPRRGLRQRPKDHQDRSYCRTKKSWRIDHSVSRLKVES
jgi:hypothetical protein